LSGIEWHITGVRDDAGRLVPAVDGVRPATISFGDDGGIAGSTGCNRFFGAGVTHDGAIVLGPLATTMMMCPDGAMTQERRILAALDAARSWELEGEILRLSDGEGRIVLEARASAS
jgi:heat shock protein HslJ